MKRYRVWLRGGSPVDVEAEEYHIGTNVTRFVNEKGVNLRVFMNDAVWSVSLIDEGSDNEKP